MPRKEKLYTAIDVGTTKVATLAAKLSPSGAMEVVAIGYASSMGMRKGLVVGAEELTESIRESVRDASQMLGKRLPPAFVGITGAHLTCANAASNLEFDNRPGAVTEADVDRVLESAVAGDGLDDRRRVVHVIPRAYLVDGTPGVRNPVGLSARRNLSVDSHVVVGDKGQLDNVARVVREAGVRVRGMILEHLASAEAVLTGDERQGGVVLVDIGGGTSDIAIYREGAVWYTSALPIAGHQFTNDIAIGLGLSPTMAEEAKVKYGSALVEHGDHWRKVELQGVDGGLPRTVSLDRVNRLLHDRAVELVRMVLAKVNEAGFKRMPMGGIVFTGGCSNLHGLVEVAQDYGKCPVRLGAPSANLGIPAELEDSKFATGVGLLLWGIRHRHAGAVARDVTVSPLVQQRLRTWMARLMFRGPTEARA
ncbi:MAG: cell division protein FtsA [Chloroflexota bacterium]|nr:cell division protein FtsA [Chloroflexota bacterium]